MRCITCPPLALIYTNTLCASSALRRAVTLRSRMYKRPRVSLSDYLSTTDHRVSARCAGLKEKKKTLISPTRRVSAGRTRSRQTRRRISGANEFEADDSRNLSGDQPVVGATASIRVPRFLIHGEAGGQFGEVVPPISVIWSAAVLRHRRIMGPVFSYVVTYKMLNRYR